MLFFSFILITYNFKLIGKSKVKVGICCSDRRNMQLDEEDIEEVNDDPQTIAHIIGGAAAN